MENVNIPIFILQLLLILVLIIILVQVLNFRHAVSLEKRIGKYGIDSINNHSESIFDKCINWYSKFIKKTSKILNHSVVIKKLSKRYEKYMILAKNDDTKPMDFISIKITLALILFIITLIYNVLQYRNFSMLQCLIILMVSLFSLNIILFFGRKQRKKQIDDDILKAIIIMNNAFKSGRTTMQAIEIVKNELTGPLQDEFKKMYIDISFGLSLDVVFERFSKRIDNEDVKYISASLTILNRTGGDIVKIFSNVEKSFFNRRKLRNELKTLTASSNIMFKVLVSAPFLIFIVIYLLNPSYFNVLFTTEIGLVISTLILLIFVLYVYFVKRTMRIKV